MSSRIYASHKSGNDDDDDDDTVILQLPGRDVEVSASKITRKFIEKKVPGRKIEVLKGDDGIDYFLSDNDHYFSNFGPISSAKPGTKFTIASISFQQMMPDMIRSAIFHLNFVQQENMLHPVFLPRHIERTGLVAYALPQIDPTQDVAYGLWIADETLFVTVYVMPSKIELLLRPTHLSTLEILPAVPCVPDQVLKCAHALPHSLIASIALEGVPVNNTELSQRIMTSMSSSTSTSSISAASSTIIPIKKVIFIGSSISGSVAHAAAISFRRYINNFRDSAGRALASAAKRICCVSFSSPPMVTEALRNWIQEQGFANDHINLTCSDDCIIHASSLLHHFRLACAEENKQVASSSIEPLVNLVQAAYKGDVPTDTGPAVVCMRNMERVVEQFLTSHPWRLVFPGDCFDPTDFHRDMSQVDFSRCGITTAAIMKHAGSYLNLIPLASDGLRASIITIPFDLSSSFAPIVDDATIVATSTRLVLTIKGKYLDTLWYRNDDSGWIRDLEKGVNTNEKPCINLQENAFTPKESVCIAVSSCSYTQAEITVVGVEYLHVPGALTVQTDFGLSSPIVVPVDKVSVSGDTSAGQLLNSLVNLDYLLAAFLRGLLIVSTSSSSSSGGCSPPPRSTSSRQSLSSPSSSRSRPPSSSSSVDFSNPLLSCLYEIENELVGECSLESVGIEYLTSTDNQSTAMLTKNKAKVALQEILKHLTKERPVTQGVASRVAKKVVGGFGLFIGGIIAVVGVIAALVPGAIMAGIGYGMMKTASAIRDENPTPGQVGQIVGLSALSIPFAIAFLPGGLVAAAGAQIMRYSFDAMKDPATVNYVNVLQSILNDLGGDSCKCLPEVIALENAIIFAFEGLIEFGRDPASATKEELRGMLLDAGAKRIATFHTEGEIKDLMTGPNPARLCDDQYLLSRLFAVFRLNKMRRLLMKQCVCSFAGVHNAGKSTIIKELFGIETHPDYLDRTEAVMLHQSEAPSLFGDFDRDFQVYYADFPGTSDERAGIARLTELYVSVSSFVVCVLKGGHIANSEKNVITSVKEAKKTFIVLINCERDFLATVNARREKFEEDYAERLGVERDCLCFVNFKNRDDVERCRSLIFKVLKMQTDTEYHASLAISMLSSRILAEIIDSHHLGWKDIGKRIDRMLTRDVAVSKASFELELNQEFSPDRSSSETIQYVRIHSILQPLTSCRFKLVYLRALSVVLSHVVMDTDRNQIKKSIVGLIDDKSQERMMRILVTILINLKSRHFSNLNIESLINKRTSPAQLVLNLSHSILEKLNILEDFFCSEISNIRWFVEDKLVYHVQTKFEEYDVASMLAEVEHACRSRNSVSRSRLSLIDEECKDSASSMDDEMRLFLLNRDHFNEMRNFVVVQMGRVIPAVDPLIDPIGVYKDKYHLSNTIEERFEIFKDKCQAEMNSRSEIHEFNVTDMPLNAAETATRIVNLVAFEDIEVFAKKKLKFRSGSEAIDIGGVTRSVMTAVSQGLGSCPCFSTDKDSGKIYFNAQIHVKQMESRLFLRGVGRLIGWCLLSNELFPVNFSPVVFKVIMGLPLKFDDLMLISEELARSVRALMMMSPDEFEGLDLSWNQTVIVDGKEEEVRLAQTIGSVRGNDRDNFIHSLMRFYFCVHDDSPVQSFVMGISDVFPRLWLSIFDSQALQLLLKGENDLDINEWRCNCFIHPELAGTTTVVWFWQYLENSDVSTRQKLLSFVTGSNCLPHGGFASLKPQFSIVSSPHKDGLPGAHVCFNMLMLPEYSSEETLSRRFTEALAHPLLQFGMA